MKRILLDENIPIRLRRLFPGMDVRHVFDQNWAGMSNGRLIAIAETSGFETLGTADRNLRYHQNLEGRHLAPVILPSNNWNAIQRNINIIVRAVTKAAPGTYQELKFGETGR